MKSNPLRKLNRQCLIIYQQLEMTQVSQICIMNSNNNLSICWNKFNEWCTNTSIINTSSKCNKINTQSKFTATAITTETATTKTLLSKSTATTSRTQKPKEIFIHQKSPYSITKNTIYDFFRISVNKISSRKLIFLYV